MKPLFRILLFIFIVGFAIFSGCQKPDANNNCTDPIAEYKFPSDASRWLFDPIKVGDTIKFKIYHRNNRSSSYVYRRTESFFIKDTMIKKIEQNNIFTFNCNQWMYSDFLVADITGPESLTCELDNEAITNINILLEGELFGLGADQYQSSQFDWDDSLHIGSVEYYNIKRWKGVNYASNNQYIDSTYCFYNLQYGMLKFIINDTLIYQRTFH